MKADHLLTAFSKIGDNPEHIQKLRKIAIALAVSGKLNSRGDSLEIPKILDSTKIQRWNSDKQGTLWKQKRSHELSEEHLPKGFNDSSRFAPLGSLARIEKGKTGIKRAQPGPFPMVVTAAERTTCDHYDFEEPAAIVPLVSSTGHGKASLHRLHYQEGKFALGTILAAIFPHDPKLISARFLFEYLSAFKEELLVSRMIGTANVSLTVRKIATVPVPLISSDVQQKVDELMAVCDELEASLVKGEETRSRLLDAMLTEVLGI